MPKKMTKKERSQLFAWACIWADLDARKEDPHRRSTIKARMIRDCKRFGMRFSDLAYHAKRCSKIIFCNTDVVELEQARQAAEEYLRRY